MEENAQARITGHASGPRRAHRRPIMGRPTAPGARTAPMITVGSPPVTIVQPSRGWWVLPLSEVWRFRDLFLLLVRRDVALRYKQTLLGLIWVCLLYTSDAADE